MPRISVLQIFTFSLLISACVFVANHVARYLLRVDGGYSEWSGFNECSRTCGGGIRLRRRECSNPYPRLGGRNCSSLGKPIQVFKCNRNPCPVNGGYGSWLSFGPCSVTCGDGYKQRRRHCNHPLPKYGGKTCKEMELGDDTEAEKCNERKCPVNGGYSEWSAFGECSVTCGGGIKTRTRECTNPTPDLDGKNCTDLGPNEETRACNTEYCPTILPPRTKPPTTTKQTTTPQTTPPQTTPPQTTTPQTTAPQTTTPSTTIPQNSKSTDKKSESNKEQNKASELNPTTFVSSIDSQQKIVEEPAKSYQESLQSTEMPLSSTGQPLDFNETIPSVAGRNDTITS
ncbi:coadhesin-like [Actinia tenebrosa]|uniref:Coadhesin-like n=1 Tax=Actinia tenebrosa TaxID=6105 RepID=A0A6P8IX41_ACTTE|nr:coadhesin-like [Actinia tenebrosa]